MGDNTENRREIKKLVFSLRKDILGAVILYSLPGDFEYIILHFLRDSSYNDDSNRSSGRSEIYTQSLYNLILIS